MRLGRALTSTLRLYAKNTGNRSKSFSARELYEPPNNVSKDVFLCVELTPSPLRRWEHTTCVGGFGLDSFKRVIETETTISEIRSNLLAFHLQKSLGIAEVA